MRRLALLVALVTLAAPAQAASVALIAFGEAAESVESAAREVAAGIDGTRVTPKSTTTADLASAQQLGVVCGPASDDCLVKLALLMRVDQLVTLAGTRTPEGIALELALVDAGLGRRAATVPVVLSGSAGARAAKLEDAVLLLLAPDRYYGHLVVNTEPAGAAVVVDGAAVTPPIDVPLRAGPHVVEVSLAGHVPLHEIVDVEPGGTTTVSYALQPAPPPTPPTPAQTLPAPPQEPAEPDVGPVPTAVSIGALAAGGILVVGGGATALALEAALRTPQGTGEERLAMHQAERVTVVLAGLGAALALGGVVGLLTAPADATATAPPGPRPFSVSVALHGPRASELAEVETRLAASYVVVPRAEALVLVELAAGAEHVVVEVRDQEGVLSRQELSMAEPDIDVSVWLVVRDGIERSRTRVGRVDKTAN